jgi:hypothetical protein
LTTQQAPEQLTWKRLPDGQYVARHGFWVYTVFRNSRAARGRQWTLEAYPEANMDASQARTGFSNAHVAKLAALRTNCFICGRTVPFGTLEPYHREKSRNLMIHTWRCRDHGPCEDERDKLLAVSAADEYASALADIVAAKARVRKLETAALELRAKALAQGTPADEIDRIEKIHTAAAGE